ncbi:MAG: hypothetical protein JXA93_14795 [Anaerolineae bacterium]|nr:hypothetical protein [Anaerolineae bacterium]
MSNHTGWQAFRAGTSLTARYPQLLLLAWAVNLLTALLLAALPALTLATGPGNRPIMRDMAAGLDTWHWIESLMSPQSAAHFPETIGLGTVLLWTLLAALVLPMLAWLLGAFLQGGILLTYHGAPHPFRWRRFVRDCWHWWGAFLLLGALQGLAALLFLLPLIAGALVAFGAGSTALGWLLLALALAVDLLGLALFEWTRILAVAGGPRDILRAFGRAACLLVRRPLPVALLYLLTLAAAAVLHAIYRLGLLPILPLDAWLAILLVTQTFLAARIATRLVRLASATTLAQSFSPNLEDVHTNCENPS